MTLSHTLTFPPPPQKKKTVAKIFRAHDALLNVFFLVDGMWRYSIDRLLDFGKNDLHKFQTSWQFVACIPHFLYNFNVRCYLAFFCVSQQS
jgi:hypothetical protein